MSGADASTQHRVAAPAAPLGRATHLCLVVHDEMELRLRLAALVHQACPALNADTVNREAFAALSIDRIGAYSAVLFIVEFTTPIAGDDPLANVTRLRNQLPDLPILVFGRGGDERCAARSIKLGAMDYWPIHSVQLDDLGRVLTTVVDGKRPAKIEKTKTAVRRGPPQIAGYRLLKKIAKSEAATVYLADNEELARPVALKVHPLQGCREDAAGDRQRFATECELLSALNHRAIADVLDFGVTDDFLYLALEYFPCGSLRERLHNPVREADAIDYARQIAEALQVVHTAKIVHGDLKPSNVMLTDDNRVVLIDFGSARSQLLAHGAGRSDATTGTPYYVCPEQIAGRDPDARGDLYSLGVMLFEMLAGALPFGGKTLVEIFTAHRSAQVPRLPPKRHRYQSLVERLLAKDPADRFPSAASFLDALNASGPGTPTHSRAPAVTTSGASDS